VSEWAWEKRLTTANTAGTARNKGVPGKDAFHFRRMIHGESLISIPDRNIGHSATKPMISVIRR
jgi:hypothetical protein